MEATAEGLWGVGEEGLEHPDRLASHPLRPTAAPFEGGAHAGFPCDSQSTSKFGFLYLLFSEFVPGTIFVFSLLFSLPFFAVQIRKPEGMVVCR